jgi:hypothetical protein
MAALRRISVAVACCLFLAAGAGARPHEVFFAPDPDPSLNHGVESLELAPQLTGPAFVGADIAYAPTPSGAVWIVADRSDCEGPATGCDISSSLGRLSSKGRLVTGIGTAGAIDLGGPSGSESAVVSDANGRAVTLSYDGGGRATVRRFLAGGAPDPSFGIGGATSLDCGCGADPGPRLAIQVDAEGRILMSFTTAVAGASQPALIVAKLFPDGTFDSGFGKGGYLRLPSTEEGPFTSPGGAIYLFHRGPTGEGPRAVERLSRQGVADTRFDRRADRAIARLERAGHLRSSRVSAVRLRPHEIVDLLFSDNSGTTVLRVGSSGNADASFGKAGAKPLSKVVVQALPLPGGATLALTTSKAHPGIELTRFRADYALDSRFGREGSAWPGGVYEEEGVSMTRASKGRVTIVDRGRRACRGTCPPQPLLLRWRVE